MPKDEPAPPADDKPVVPAQPETPAEPSEAEQDAINSITEGVKGALTTNEDPLAGGEETDEGGEDEADESDESGADDKVANEAADDTGAEAADEADTPPASAKPATELVPEKDEAGVYDTKQVTDPGEFKPSDYSFKVNTTDGKTHTISTPEEARALAEQLDQDPSLIIASQFLELGSKTALMESNIESDRKIWAADKEAFEANTNQNQVREQQLQQWQGEVAYLRQKGELPPVTDALNNADWSDPKVASQPGVKETLDLFKWMEAENGKRLAAGLQPDLSAVSAYQAMQLETIRTQAKNETTRERTATRTRGGMVGGKTSFTPSNAPKNSIVGTPGTLDDLVSDYY